MEPLGQTGDGHPPPMCGDAPRHRSIGEHVLHNMIHTRQKVRKFLEGDAKVDEGFAGNGNVDGELSVAKGGEEGVEVGNDVGDDNGQAGELKGDALVDTKTLTPTIPPRPRPTR